jgi:hypothetical protein
VGAGGTVFRTAAAVRSDVTFTAAARRFLSRGPVTFPPKLVT